MVQELVLFIIIAFVILAMCVRAFIVVFSIIIIFATSPIWISIVVILRNSLKYSLSFCIGEKSASSFFSCVRSPSAVETGGSSLGAAFLGIDSFGVSVCVDIGPACLTYVCVGIRDA